MDRNIKFNYNIINLNLDIVRTYLVILNSHFNNEN